MNPAIIQPDFWFNRRDVNAQRAIFHQWDQLEASGCIENFRIAAGLVEGTRDGWFFADSDAYKWLEAASRIWPDRRDSRLGRLIDSLIDLIASAQMPDGYLFTFNQIHFPGTRWQNLQIEHELYCHGHLIEAGVSHYEATGRTDLFEIARRAADRIVEDFQGKGAAYTPGHEEIEIALLRLHQVSPRDSIYLDLARQFIEQRGRTPRFAISLFRQNSRVNQRAKIVRQMRQSYIANHPDYKPYQLPPGNFSKKQLNTTARWLASALSGKYLQQHAPIREQTVPVGHSVRFGYLETAAAMLQRVLLESGVPPNDSDQALLSALEAAWEHMVTRRMYVTGGIGSVPGIEGFGNDYELDPEYAYAETCAALASLFWNWQMALLTGEAKYSDLFEWQLYNAAAVGMGVDGTTYLYNNPLACHGGVIRQPWYAVPCCPSNISRTWANLGRYIFSSEPSALYIHQYISSELRNEIIPGENGSSVVVSLVLNGELPWEGNVRVKLLDITPSTPDQMVPLKLLLRRPSWTNGMRVAVNGHPIPDMSDHNEVKELSASGYDPRLADFWQLSHPWSAGDEIEISLDMPIQLRRASPRVKGHQGKVALTRGPLVYCLENVDNPDVDIFAVRLNPDSLVAVFDPLLLEGITKIQGETYDQMPLTFIPYFLWGNRGPSQMTVWVRS